MPTKRYRSRRAGAARRSARLRPADRGRAADRGPQLALRTGEIDVVAEGPGLLVFCEVKTRRGDGYGTPAAAVDAAKQAFPQARRGLLRATPHRPCKVRFDVVTVVWPRRGEPRVEHLKGVL